MGRTWSAVMLFLLRPTCSSPGLTVGDASQWLGRLQALRRRSTPDCIPAQSLSGWLFPEAPMSDHPRPSPTCAGTSLCRGTKEDDVSMLQGSSERYIHLQKQTSLGRLDGFVHSTHDRRQHLIHLVLQRPSDLGVLWLRMEVCCNICDDADRESRVLSQVGQC